MPSEDTQFKPGESGNPKGRPTFREIIEKVGNEVDPGQKYSNSERMIRAQFALAIEGSDTTASKFLAQHAEGTKADVTSDGEKLNQSVIVYLPDNKRDSEPKTD